MAGIGDILGPPPSSSVTDLLGAPPDDTEAAPSPPPSTGLTPGKVLEFMSDLNPAAGFTSSTIGKKLGITPSSVGEFVSQAVPGVGVTNALAGKELEFGNPGSPFPTGVKDTNTIFGNIRDKQYMDAAFQAIGMVPDASYIAKGLSAVRPMLAARAASKAMNAPVSLMDEKVANPLNKVATGALTELQDVMKAANLTPERLQARLKQLGKGATPADIPELRGFFDKIMANSPNANSVAKTFAARDAMAPSRLGDIFKETLSDKPFHETKDLIEATKNAVTKPMYERAFSSSTPVWDDQLGALLQDPQVAKSVKAGVKNQWTSDTAKFAKGEGPEPKMADYSITSFDESGDPVLSKTPTLRVLDAAKRNIDAQLDNLRDPVTRRLDLSNQNARSLNDARDALVHKMDQLSEVNPDTGVSFYKEARAESEKYKKLQNALDFGYDSIKNDGEVNKQILDRMGPDEKEIARRGLARNLTEMADKDPQSTINALSGRDARLKLRPLFSSRADYLQFRRGILSEAEMAQTSARPSVTGALDRTSKEATSLGDMPELGEAGQTALDMAKYGPKAGFLKGAFRWGKNKIIAPPDYAGMSDQLTDFFKETNADKRARVMTRMRGDTYLPPANPQLPEP